MFKMFIIITLLFSSFHVYFENKYEISPYLLVKERILSGFDKSKSSTLVNRYNDSMNVINIIEESSIIGNGFGKIYTDSIMKNST